MCLVPASGPRKGTLVLPWGTSRGPALRGPWCGPWLSAAVGIYVATTEGGSLAVTKAVGPQVFLLVIFCWGLTLRGSSWH